MTILATIVVLGVLIFVHELGHFLAAKAVDVEVQRFSIGLGPRVWGFQWGETDYVISAIPLGGYVKMGGMEDEILEQIEGGPVEGDEQRTPGPRDLDGKPIWARGLVFSAGVIMNMVFAFAAYSAALGFWGYREVDTIRVGEVREYLLPAGTESLTRIEPGARIQRVGSARPAHWGDVRDALLDAPAGPLEISFEDPAGRIEIRAPSSREERRRLAGALAYWLEPRVGAVTPGSPAEKGGLEDGDRVVSVDGVPVASWWELVDLIQERGDRRTEVLIRREGRELVRVVTPEPTEETDPATGRTVTVGKVGIYPPVNDWVYEDVGAVEALRSGYRETVATTALILGFLGDLVTGDISPRSMGSIVTIGEASGEAAQRGVESFLRFMALFSVNLAILNLLPIPILDGGHLLFLGIEAVRGRALTVEQRLKWSNVGFLIVMGLMIWALSNDFLRLFGL